MERERAAAFRQVARRLGPDGGALASESELRALLVDELGPRGAAEAHPALLDTLVDWGTWARPPDEPERVVARRRDADPGYRAPATGDRVRLTLVARPAERVWAFTSAALLAAAAGCLVMWRGDLVLPALWALAAALEVWRQRQARARRRAFTLDLDARAIRGDAGEARREDVRYLTCVAREGDSQTPTIVVGTRDGARVLLTEPLPSLPEARLLVAWLERELGLLAPHEPGARARVEVEEREEEPVAGGADDDEAREQDG